MTDPQAPEELDPKREAKRLRAEEAAELLDEKGVFMIAVRGLRRLWFDQLMKSGSGDLMIVSRLQALEAIPAEMQRFINDYKVELSKAKKHG